MSKLREAKHHVNITLEMDELDITSVESKACYEDSNQPGCPEDKVKATEAAMSRYQMI